MKWVTPLLFLVLSSVSAWGQSVRVTPSVTTLAAAGGEVTFTVTLTYSGELAGLDFEMGRVPAGWAYGTTGTTNRPSIAPRAGDTGSFSFAYISIPASPVTFTFTANYGAGLTGDQVLSQISAGFRALSGSRQTATATDVVLTAAPASGGGGTGGGGSGGGGGTVVPPAIASQPVGASLNEGSNLTLSVIATGSLPLTYQWSKDGASLAGATNAQLGLVSAPASAAGSYRVAITNSAGSVTSAAAVVTVTKADAATMPQITQPPAAQTVALGANVTFTVVATGTGPLTYQWQKDGAAVAGATGATLALSAVQAAAGGVYAVAIANSAGTVTSAGARLTVSTVPVDSVAGAYFGTFSDGGKFAVLVRDDRSATFLARTPAVGLLGRGATVDAAGRFQFTASALGAGSAALSSPGTAAAPVVYTVDGTIGSGGLRATVSGLNADLSAPVPAKTGGAAALVGYYQGGVSGGSAAAHLIVGPADVFFLSVNNGTVDSGRGEIDATGALNVLTDRGARVTGLVAANTGLMAATMTPAGAAPITFVGAEDTTRTNVEKLINISTRSRVGAGSELIAGFVIVGTAPKPVLVRAIGPSLSAFGVGDALASVRLQIYRDGTLVATGDDWGRATNATAITATAARVGAFALSPSSQDAALLVTLEPGGYTAVVSGRTGAPGVSLIEVYDGTEGTIPRSQRIINISTRAVAGSGDGTLIAGFVIDGLVPKRVLVRAAGPALAQFGVTGVLARPRVGVYSAETMLRDNAAWSSSPDADAIADAAATVGAFAFAPQSADGALIIHLAPGAYTAQVSGENATSGNALLEVYELP